MTGFIKLCKTANISDNKGIKVSLQDNTEIAVFNIKGNYYAFENLCPHNHTPKICDGFIKEDFIICPVHFYQFNIITGEAKENFMGKLRVYETKIEDEYLFIKIPDKKLFDFKL